MKNISKERMTFSWRKINHYDVKMWNSIVKKQNWPYYN
jgi:hypothetical protein